MENVRTYLPSILLVLIISSLLSFIFGYQKGRRGANPGVIVKTDTLVVYETKVVEKPVSVKETVIRHDTIFWFQTDTLRTHSTDTVRIPVPISQKYYEEQDGHLRLWISGYRPSLDRYELDEKTVTVTDVVKKKWNFSVGAGPAVIYTPFHSCPIDAGIGVFGGVTYSF